MKRATPIAAIANLAAAVGETGFSLDHMMELLNAGLSVESLIKLIAWRLERRREPRPLAASSCWTM